MQRLSESQQILYNMSGSGTVLVSSPNSIFRPLADEKYSQPVNPAN